MLGRTQLPSASCLYANELHKLELFNLLLKITIRGSPPWDAATQGVGGVGNPKSTRHEKSLAFTMQGTLRTFHEN